MGGALEPDPLTHDKLLWPLTDTQGHRVMGWVISHKKILVTAQRPNSPPFPFGPLTGRFGLGLVNTTVSKTNIK